MHSRYFEDDIPGSGINANEFLSPGGNKKAIRIKCLENLKVKKEDFLMKSRRCVNFEHATSLKFRNFKAKCEPKKVLSTVLKLFKSAKSVKLGKLRPNQKKGIKTEWVYNGWVNFFGIGDCNRAKRRIQKKPHKYGQMKIERVGSIRILGFDAKKKYVQIPRFRVPAKEKVPRQYFIWGKRLSPKNYSKFAVDEFSSLLSNVVLVY